MLAEERIGIDDVAELAPVAPFPRERPQGERLARSSGAVPEYELPSVGGSEAAHDRLEVFFGADAVVRLDLVPAGDRDRAPRGLRPLRSVGPEGDGNFVLRAGVGRRQQLVQTTERTVDRLALVRRQGRVYMPGEVGEEHQRAVELVERRRATFTGLSFHRLAELRLFGGGPPCLLMHVAEIVVRDTRQEEGADPRSHVDVLLELDTWCLTVAGDALSHLDQRPYP